MARITIGIAAMMCAMALNACGGAGSTTSEVRGISLPVISSHRQVLLVPSAQAGFVGWCMTVTPGIGGCEELRGSTTGILAERWVGGGSTVVGAAITSDAVNEVTVGRSVLPTRSEYALPTGFRGVVVEIRLNHLPPRVRAERLHFTALNANGKPVRQSVPSDHLGVEMPVRSWRRLESTPCKLLPPHIDGLVGPTGNVVVDNVKSHQGLVGRPFLTCASAVYNVPGVYAPLFVGVLLNAAHPGSTPGALPAMKPIPGHPGTFRALTGEGEAVARRIPHAWLVVAYGAEGDAEFQRQLSVLDYVRAVVHV